MKVEKISENKIRITLTFEELENRKISLRDIEKSSSFAKNLFLDLIEESNLEDEFIIDDSQLFIEACSDNNELFIVTITKLDSIPELKKYASLDLEKKKSRINEKSKNTEYKVDSNIYSFNTIEDILNISDICKKEKLFFGKNSLYKYKDSYFIIFSKSSIKNVKFLKTFVFLSEYCKSYYSDEMLEISIKEKSNIVIENNALQTLCKI